MQIEQILKSNGITQEQFAEYMGMTREAINKSLKRPTQKKGLINNLKMMVAEKRGIKIDIKL